ncbi:hypothetical protein THAOC_29698 [Thalassiosira oceanica]|uniref:Uncharacterized protein n=1 Tax=Thalassiosira oceanica TaxID=159749 RepID=K0RFW9_THAOC|nr:hypothetical protein THAOC_29698 [Thalassiosira oceanica]|eukprot:EJK51154.1 hypothetical protein THAOC_29698 [Thalassiosira oceanica]
MSNNYNDDTSVNNTSEIELIEQLKHAKEESFGVEENENSKSRSKSDGRYGNRCGHVGRDRYRDHVKPGCGSRANFHAEERVYPRADGMNASDIPTHVRVGPSLLDDRLNDEPERSHASQLDDKLRDNVDVELDSSHTPFQSFYIR